jgi:endonuclease/exonuclease/phosphatase family metal-dependent hydrolase
MGNIHGDNVHSTGKGTSESMRIMCLNGWGGVCHEALVGDIGAIAADVLCLQEVVHTPDAPNAWLTYRDGAHVLPQRANFFGDVANALPHHAALFCPAARGPLWDGETEVASFWGLATFVAPNLTTVRQAQDFVHKDYSPHGYGEHPRSRNAHGVRLYHEAARRFVTIVHMHGLRDLNGKGDTPERLAQAERLAALTASLAQPRDRLTVCGDFNVEPGSETFAILARLGLNDLVTAGGWPGTRTSLYTKEGSFADHMLVDSLTGADPRFEVLYEPEMSDHAALVLDF